MASLAASNCASAFKGHFGGSTLISVVSGSATAVYILLRWRGGVDGASAAAAASRAAAYMCILWLMQVGPLSFERTMNQ